MSKKKEEWRDEDGDFNFRKLIKVGITVLVVIVALFILWPFKSIGPTERGVIKTFGKVGNNVLDPGLHFKIPLGIQRITAYDLTPNLIKIDIPMGDDGAASKDKQTIGVKGSVIWKYDDSRIINLATGYSSERALEDQVRATAINAIKQTIGRYDIGEIVQDQAKLAEAAKNRMIQEFMNWPVSIDVVNLDNWDWSEDYDKMIKETVAMQQATQRATAELAMIEQTAQKQIKEATAKAEADAAAAEGRRRAAELDAQAAIAKAKGEAEAKRIEGEGIANYNRLIVANFEVQRAQWNYEIELEKAKRWNGVNTSTYLPLSPNGGVVTLPAK